jgi:hypothetical protein
VIEPESQQDEQYEEQQTPNVATIAFLGFMAGLVLWVGGACLVLGSGSDGASPLSPGSISTPGVQQRATATAASHRTDCAAIRGTEYQSEAERQWFIQNCT